MSRNVAELQRNVTEDVNGFYTVVLNILQLIAEVSVCVVLVIYLMSTDIMTTIVVAALIFIFAIFFGIVFKKVLVKKGQENRQVSISLTKWVLQSFSGIKEIKVMNKEKFSLIIMIKHINGLLFCNVSRQCFHLFQGQLWKQCVYADC